MDAVLRAFFGYMSLVLIVRIVGRRPGKQLTPFEFVLIFFIGGLALAAIVGDEMSLLVLVKNGERQTRTMRGMRTDAEDVMAAARAKRVGSIFDVKYAILERNGTISIIKREVPQ